ncbi:class I SAM-dependent methyltransferase [Salinirussus salinus]|uniref:class I SAM-dependent methyltransferase n=1 Tax=Salinirussus salinus TaxID=1198300 RepID=UPI00135C06FA
MSDGDPEAEEPGDTPSEHRSPERVREVYDRIAAHFAETRHHAWPESREFLDGRSGAVGLDVGCGNGRNAELLAERVDRALGLDASRGLLGEARSRVGETVELVQGDAGGLPVTADTVDIALYIATLHHLADRETRRASLAELARVLAPDGRALVSVWSTTHDRFDAGPEDPVGFDTTVDWTLPNGETVPRFYHIYAPAEFEADLAASPLTVEATWLASGNCYARVRGE